MVIRMGDSRWDRLFAIWKAERRPSILLSGVDSYQVFTPDGDDFPVFSLVGEVDMYSQTSTGVVRSDPVPEKPVVPKKVSRAVGKKLGDVS
jgi:hypothetical protein